MLCQILCKNQTVFFVVQRGQFGNMDTLFLDF